VVFTAGSVVVHKREASAASKALEQYKLDTANKVADATTAGIAAGEKAGHAQADVDATKIELAKQQTKTEEARSLAKGFESKIAESDARAKTAEAQVATAMAASEEASAKAELFRRDIARANESAAKAEAQVASAKAEAANANLQVARLKLPRSLSDVPSLILSLVAFKGTKYTFTGVGPDEDSIMLLRTIDDALQKAGWERTLTPGFPGINVYGTLPNNFAVPNAILDGIRIEVERPDAPLDLNKQIIDFPPLVQCAVALNFAIFSRLSPPESSVLPRIVSVVKGQSESIKISVGRKIVAP
jgi:hypothetical protein